MHKGPPAPIVVITSHHPVAKSCHSCSIMNLPFIWTSLSAISLLMPASGFVRPLRHSGRYTYTCDESLAGTFRENGLFSSESDDLNIAHQHRSKENDKFGTREAQSQESMQGLISLKETTLTSPLLLTMSPHPPLSMDQSLRSWHGIASQLELSLAHCRTCHFPSLFLC